MNRDPYDLMTRADLRKLLQVSTETFRLALAAGELPPPSLVIRNSPRWLWKDVRLWLREWHWVHRGADQKPPESPKKTQKAPKTPSDPDGP